MARAGKRDRLITFQRNSGGTNAFNEQVESWGTLTVGAWAGSDWAEKKEVSDAERWRAGEVGASISVRFHLPYHAGTAAVTPADRITFDSITYNITGIKELGRAQGFEITAAARAD